MKTLSLSLLLASAALGELPGYPVDSSRTGKEGLRAGGVADSRLLRARLSGAGVDPESPTGENLAYSRADLRLIARPNDLAGGRLEIRVHQDWNRYYEEGPNPLVIRWLDFTGQAPSAGLKYALGDFRARWSPLTVASPEPELLPEAAPFARQREAAMGEWFLGDGAVPLQGARIAYATPNASRLTLHADAFGARLRRADPDGSLAWRFRTGDADRWAAGATASAKAFNALEAGFTGLRVFDPVSVARARNPAQSGAAPATLFEANQVLAPRLAFDAAPFLTQSPWTFRLFAEFARSAYSSGRDSVTGSSTALRQVESLTGDALLATLATGWRRGEAFTVSLDLAYLQVGPGYVNDLAQSPAFLGRRILNSKNPVGGALKGYSTLDALYHHAFDIRPLTNQNSLEGWGAGASRPYNGTNNWLRTASFKNSYASSVSTYAERKASEAGLDPHVQLIYPYGRATAKRKGLDGSLSAAAWEGALKAALVFARLKELEATDSVAAPATYARNGAGLSVDLGPWVPRVAPWTLSAGWRRDSRNAYQVTWLNAGASIRARAWLTLEAAWQSVGSDSTAIRPGVSESQWVLGLTTGLGPGVSATAEWGRLSFQEKGGKAAFTQQLVGAGLRIGF